MRYTIEEYEALALEAIEDARSLPEGQAHRALAIAQVDATLALRVLDASTLLLPPNFRQNRNRRFCAYRGL